MPPIEKTERRRIGLLGGSFNPPHQGHREISLAALERLGLEQFDAAGVALLRSSAIVQNEATQDGGGIHSQDSLEGEGVILRGFPSQPALRDYLRISVGTEEELERLGAVFDHWENSSGDMPQ